MICLELFLCARSSGATATTHFQASSAREGVGLSLLVAARQNGLREKLASFGSESGKKQRGRGDCGDTAQTSAECAVGDPINCFTLSSDLLDALAAYSHLYLAATYCT
jgi:hypothetical protein